MSLVQDPCSCMKNSLLFVTIGTVFTSYSFFTVKLCTNSEFKCLTGGDCISLFSFCDDTPDCEDGSDELICGKFNNVS